MDEIYARMPQWVIGVEDYNWYDWIAYYFYQAENKRFSRNWYPIARDEMCLPWEICKVKWVKDWPGDFEYHWKILSRRPDTDGSWE